MKLEQICEKAVLIKGWVSKDMYICEAVFKECKEPDKKDDCKIYKDKTDYVIGV